MSFTGMAISWESNTNFPLVLVPVPPVLPVPADWVAVPVATPPAGAVAVPVVPPLAGAVAVPAAVPVVATVGETLVVPALADGVPVPKPVVPPAGCVPVPPAAEVPAPGVWFWF